MPNRKQMREPGDVSDLIGVWRRKSIEWSDRTIDFSGKVWWLQGCPHFSDIRVPSCRPDFSGVKSLSDCNSSQSNWLKKQQGFAGKLVQHGYQWIWNREFDFQPPSGKRDIGLLAYAARDQSIMIECGVDEPYTEIWERIDDAASTGRRALVLRLDDTDEKGLFIAVGEHFLMAVGKPPWNLEISHGLRRDGFDQWIIADSTFPWREGVKVFDFARPELDWNNRIIRASRIWTIVEPEEIERDWLTRILGI